MNGQLESSMKFPTVSRVIEGIDNEALNEFVHKTLERHANQVGFNLGALDDTDLMMNTPLVELTIDGEAIKFKLFRLCLVEEDNMAVVLESDWSDSSNERRFVGLKGTYDSSTRREGRYGKLDWTASDVVCIIPTSTEWGEQLCSEFYGQAHGSLFTLFGL